VNETIEGSPPGTPRSAGPTRDIPRARIVGYYRDFCLGGLTGLLEQPDQ
jgi:hypothetical protein